MDLPRYEVLLRQARHGQAVEGRWSSGRKNQVLWPPAEVKVMGRCSRVCIFQRRVRWY
jgi:hypothetical protein